MTLLSIIISLSALVSLCAVVYPFKPFKSRGFAFLSFLGLCLLNGLIAMGASSHSETTVKMTPTAPKQSVVEPSLSVPAKAEDLSKWEYNTSMDEMTGVTSKTACTTSTNELDFDFPYNGGASGELCFRRKGKALNAWLRMSKGQFACSIDDCVLKLKFDEVPIQSYSASESTSHTTGMLFFNSEMKLLTSASKASKLKLQANFYESGNRVLYFDVGHLDLKQL